MSYIRRNQDSQYVDLHNGSRAYIYNNGNGIDGVGSYGEFIDALCIHASGANLGEDFIGMFEMALEDHFGEHRREDRDEPFKAIGPKAEMAHIIAQMLDVRLSSLTLTDDIQESLQAYAQESFTDCPECGTTHRPDINTPDEQGDLCQECYIESLKEMNLSVDVSELREYVNDELPDRVAPEEFHDDEFFALCTELFMKHEGAEREALHHLLGEDAADEVMGAIMEDRPVDKESIHETLDTVSK